MQLQQEWAGTRAGEAKRTATSSALQATQEAETFATSHAGTDRWIPLEGSVRIEQ